MYSEWFVFAFIAVAIVWLSFLSYKIKKQNEFLKSLFPKSGERDIRKKFEELLLLEDKLDSLGKEVGLSVQKVAVLRYNPYGDTGGDQSFSMALLNGENSGLVLTSLHSRSGTRVYAKPVVKGKAGNFQLSKEEEEVIKKAT